MYIILETHTLRHTLAVITAFRPLVCRFVSDQYFVQASLLFCLLWLVLPSMPSPHSLFGHVTV